MNLQLPSPEAETVAPAAPAAPAPAQAGKPVRARRAASKAAAKVLPQPTLKGASQEAATPPPAVAAAAGKPAARRGAKAAAKPAPAKSVKAAKVAKVAAMPAKAKAAKAAAPQAAPVAVPAAKPPVVAPAGKQKHKLVRDSFTIPKDEYGVLVGLKQRAGQLARHAKKSEILRAGVQLLSGLPDTAFLAALAAVPSLKTGRPKQDAATPAAGGGKKSAR